MGGNTSEHEVSLASGIEVSKALEKKGHQVIPLIVSRNGHSWNRLTMRDLYSLPDPLNRNNRGKQIIKISRKNMAGPGKMADGEIDMCFIAMHGTCGEDGTIQGMLELFGIAYTGCGVLASALGMDKQMFRKFLDGLKITYPKYQVLSKIGRIGVEKYPVFVKPNRGGSSVGVSKVNNNYELNKALKLAFAYDQQVLVEEGVEGREFTCGILGNTKVQEVLPVVEIMAENDFFDYNSKYLSEKTLEVCPANIENSLAEKISDISLRIFREIGAKGMIRVDLMVDKNNQPYVLEINTIPGLTPVSLLPKAAKVAGYSYEDLIDKICQFSLDKVK